MEDGAYEFFFDVECPAITEEKEDWWPSFFRIMSYFLLSPAGGDDLTCKVDLKTVLWLLSAAWQLNTHELAVIINYPITFSFFCRGSKNLPGTMTKMNSTSERRQASA